MKENLREILSDRLTAPSTGKVMALSEAVRKFVRPGMMIHHGAGLSVPMAAHYEIVRQFWGKNPQFILISTGGGVYNFALYVFGGLCRKIISGFNGDGYPFPGPNPILSRAFKEGKVEHENWSFLSITERLMAGAMGVPAFPTKSLYGSSIASDNPDSFRTLEDPFGTGEKLHLVKALKPDISLVHGWAADPEGNTILAAPYHGNFYGPLAAKEGVIVTVEKVVEADFIRRHSPLVKIPSYIVRAVCPAPFGAHPTGMHPWGLMGGEGYGEDEEFILEARKACRSEEDYRAWVEKWVLSCRNHEEFVKKLGQERVWFLKGRIQEDSWISELAEREDGLESPATPTDQELLIYAAARWLKRTIERNDYRLILCGIGVSNLAAWLAHEWLRKEGFPVELVAEVGFYGYIPCPADPFIFNLRNIPSCRMISDIFTTLALIMGGAHTRSIGVLGAGQVDRFGNVNTTELSSTGPFLVGSGGANDVASAASEIMVTLHQERSRFLERVPYITSPGKQVRTVVSQMGVFEKGFGDEELILTAYYPRPGQTEEETIREIKESCGWDLKVKEPPTPLTSPALEDLLRIRIFDPKRLFLGHG
ncbi:MAG TPA: CoA-transferase [Syntrophales bacterium]|nr:CoA-transferase [Syntrophales bacterium]